MVRLDRSSVSANTRRLGLLSDASTHLIGVATTVEPSAALVPAVLVPASMKSGAVTVAENDRQDHRVQIRELQEPRRHRAPRRTGRRRTSCGTGRSDEHDARSPPQRLSRCGCAASESDGCGICPNLSESVRICPNNHLAATVQTLKRWCGHHPRKSLPRSARHEPFPAASRITKTTAACSLPLMSIKSASISTASGVFGMYS